MSALQPGEIPQLKIEKLEYYEADVPFNVDVSSETLRNSVNLTVLEYFRGRESSDIIMKFRSTNPKNFREFYKFIKAGGAKSYEEAAQLFKEYL
ncbi:MAG: hypothetical protein LBD75_02340 [Candidatus Peribacteria bacterium]|jgi:hypothetical protein|nr:hypothetical protein [Candidatus Peribacteria bacterium]